MRAGVIGCLISAVAMSIIGCSASNAPPTVSPQPFVGPSISLENSRDMHVIMVQNPSAGYSVFLDRVEEERGHQQAFITIRTPNPRFSYPQVMVEQRVQTPVRASVPLKVSARLLGLDEEGTTYYPAIAP